MSPTGSDDIDARPEDSPPYLAALAAGASLLLLYLLTLAPGTAFWDASEYIATAHILGIPHPPGNPLFVVLGKVWLTLLAPTGLSVALRMNLFAAVTSAMASGFFFLVAHRAVKGLVPAGRPQLVGAYAATLLGGTAFTVWNQSTVNEKVYTFSVLVIAAVSWLVVRWLDRKDEPGSDRLILGAGYLMVLGSANHLMSAIPFPAVGLIVLLGGASMLVRRSFLVRAIPLVLLGLSFNFILPIRAAQDPVINEGEPTCEDVGGAAVAVFSNGRAGCRALAANLQREQYQKPALAERMAPLSHQVQNWLQYFDWQWSRGLDASEMPGTTRTPFTLAFLILGLLGLWTVGSRHREMGIYLGTLGALLTVGLVFYLNFKYGYSLAPEITDARLHEVRERDYFFIAGFMLWGVMSGVGLTWVWREVASRITAPRAYLMASPVLAFAAIPLFLNWGWASRSGDFSAEDWAYDLLVSVEPYAVLFTNGDNDTFPLWYLQEVEGFRRDVTVVVGEYLSTEWYPDQLKRLTSPEGQRTFDPDSAGGMYSAPPVPSLPIIDLERDVMDAVVGGTLAEDLTVSFPELAVTFPQGMYLGRNQRLALVIIRQALGERPIYFSSSAGMMNQLGLSRWAVRKGLVSKLDFRSLEGEVPPEYEQASPNLGGEWFDYERTLHLYRNVYRYRGLLDREIWSDRANLGIPWQYYALALQMADVGSRRGLDGSEVAQFQADGENFLATAQGGTKGTPGGAPF